MDVEMGNLPTSTYFGYEKDANVSVGDSVTLEFLQQCHRGRFGCTEQCSF